MKHSQDDGLVPDATTFRSFDGFMFIATLQLDHARRRAMPRVAPAWI
jgi:hypothetical protein